MGQLKFVDTHIHFWVLHHPDLYYTALQPDSAHPQIGPQWDKLKTADFVAEDYVGETRNANVTKAVHVQAALGTKDPVKETEWVQQAADRTGFPLAIVAYSDLRMPNVEEELARHCQFPNMRGIREFSAAEHLDDPDFQRGYALLEKFNLVHSFNIEWEDMNKTRDLAIKFPNVMAVCDHAGFPKARTDEYFRSWQKGITALAEAENVVCKISGLGMADWNWTVDSIWPWVLHCIEAFGPERCIFGTNWSVDRLFSTYDVLIAAYTEIISEFSEDEQIAMFSGNAERLYRF
jgi:predicted TIM-barrel fold metal-dependent hydrolase